jgi:hypothetical protein
LTTRRQRLNLRTGGFLGIEKKFYDTTGSATAIASPTDASGGLLDPVSGALNTMVQGDGQSQRDGRQVRMVSIQVKGVVQIPTQAAENVTDIMPCVSIYIVLDTQTNGAQLNTSNVFTNPSGSAVTAATIYRNLQFSKRFRILKHKIIRLPMATMASDAVGTFGISGSNVPFECYKKLGYMQVNYTGTTENISNITDNSLHIVAFSSNNSMNPALIYNSRLRYVG